MGTRRDQMRAEVKQVLKDGLTMYAQFEYNENGRFLQIELLLDGEKLTETSVSMPEEE